jgi:hypothetical protein
VDYKDLSVIIETLREKIILTGISKGLSSPDTLRISELDKLLNKQME